MAAKAEVVELTPNEKGLLVDVCEAEGELAYEENKGEALDGLISHSLVDVVDGKTLCATEAGEKAAKSGKVSVAAEPAAVAKEADPKEK